MKQSERSVMTAQAYEVEAPQVEAQPVDWASPQVGHVAELDAQGRASVLFPGHLLVPVPARSTVSATAEGLLGAAVLLAFENADPARPIIVGLLREALATGAGESGCAPAPAAGDSSRRPDSSAPRDGRDVEAEAQAAAETAAETAIGAAARDIHVDAAQLVFDAERMITLRCGKSLLQLRPDGKVLIRGTNILSRSSGMNRIKGASIGLN